jgi:hypothetical protein
LFVSTSSLVDAGAGARLGGCEDARKGEVEWKKGCRAETFRKTGKKGCEDAGMQKRSERRGDVRRRVGGGRGDAAMTQWQSEQ